MRSGAFIASSATVAFPCGSSNQMRSFVGEVVAPSLAAWMKERNDPPGLWFDAGEIWSFEPVAVRAGEREVISRIAPAVLSRDDVFDVKTQFGKSLRQPAVFAAVVSPGANQLAHKFARHRVHQASFGPCKNA